jgi:DNA-binding response OmpR family regulator
MDLTFVPLVGANAATGANVAALESLGHNVAMWSGSADALIRTAGDVIIVDATIDPYAAQRFCRRLSELRSHAPVIAILSEGALERFSSSWGATDFVLDGGSAVELAVRATRSARAGDRPSDTRQHRGRHTLNHDLMTLSDDAAEVELTKVEHAVLSVFFARPDVIVTRADLLRLCWEDPDDVSARAVDTLLCRMRKKLADCGLPIVTVRNLGYRFTPQYRPSSSASAA